MKVRKEIKIEKDVLDGLAALGKAEGRTLGNFIIKILTDYEKEKTKNRN